MFKTFAAACMVALTAAINLESLAQPGRHAQKSADGPPKATCVLDKEAPESTFFAQNLNGSCAKRPDPEVGCIGGMSKEECQRYCGKYAYDCGRPGEAEKSGSKKSGSNEMEGAIYMFRKFDKNGD